MRHLNLAIVGGISFAAGLLVGLSIAVVCESDDSASAKVIAEQDCADELPNENAAVERGTEELRSALEEAKAEAAHNEKISKEMIGHWLCTSVLLHLCVENPPVLDILRHPDFQQAFRQKTEWYYPEDAYQLIGSRWFRDELRAAGWPGVCLEFRRCMEETIAKEKAEGSTSANPAAPVTRNSLGRLAGRSQSSPPNNRRFLTIVKGTKATDTFRIGASKWCLSWRRIGHGRTGRKSISITVHRVGGDMVAYISGDIDDDDSIIRTAPGDFYLEVSTGDATIEFSTEEMEPDGAGSKPEQATETVAPWRETKHKPVRTAPW